MRKSQENNNKKTILWWKNLPSLRAWICAGIPVIKPTSLGVFDVWKNAGWCDRGRCIRISHILIFLNLPQLLSVFFSVESCFFSIVQKKIYCTLCLGTIPTFFRSDGFPSWKPKKKGSTKIDTVSFRQGACHHPWLELQDAIAYEITNPNKALWRGNPLEFTMHLHCLYDFPKMGQFNDP